MNKEIKSSQEMTKELIKEIESGKYDNGNVYGKHLHQSSRFNDKPLENISATIKGGNMEAGVINGLRIRKLTPKECWRLMGFDDNDFDKAEKVNSNTQLYKQAGNSIVVNVLERILENLIDKNEHIKILELFGGIGACSKALERLGIDYEIADYVEIDKYAVNSYNAMHNTNFEPQDITTWDKDIDCNLIMHGSPCFVAGTKILTNNGYKNIENIKIGDLVLTHNNCFKRVLQVGSDGKKPIYRLEAQGILPIECTDNHPFYVRHKTKRWNNHLRKYEYSFSEPEKVRLYNLTKNNNYIGVPIIPDIKNDFYELDDEILWLLGRYVADGHIDTKTNKCVILSIGKDKIKDFAQIKTEYKQYLHHPSCYRIIFNASSILYKLVSSGLFGTSALYKTIPLEILLLPKHKLKIFLDGYMSGDGCKIKNTTTYQATTISRELAESLVLAVQKVYKIGCRIYYTERPKKHNIEGRIVNQHDTYMIRFDLKPKKPLYLIDNNCIWYPIKNIKNINKQEIIYNIEVEDDHTYTSNNCYCFNCQDFSLAGLQAGGDEGSGTRSSLMYETIRIVEKLKPKYVIWENVKNLISKKHKHNFDAYIERMSQLGYKSYYQVLNAKDYGIPQNRERVFTVSIRNDIYYKQGSFWFPPKQELKLKLKDMLEDNVDEKYYLSDKMINYISARGTANFKNPDSRINLDVARPLTTDPNKRAGTTNYLSDDLPNNYNLEEVNRLYGIFDDEKGTHQAGSVYDKEGLSPTLDTMQGGYRQPCIEIKNATKKGYLEATDGDGVNIGSRMKYQRGNVQKGMSQTITTSGGSDRGVVINTMSEDKWSDLD